jgi:hypothetical protein
VECGFICGVPGMAAHHTTRSFDCGYGSARGRCDFYLCPLPQGGVALLPSLYTTPRFSLTGPSSPPNVADENRRYGLTQKPLSHTRRDPHPDSLVQGRGHGPTVSAGADVNSVPESTPQKNVDGASIATAPATRIYA